MRGVGSLSIATLEALGRPWAFAGRPRPITHYRFCIGYKSICTNAIAREKCVVKLRGFSGADFENGIWGVRSTVGGTG